MYPGFGTTAVDLHIWKKKKEALCRVFEKTLKVLFPT
jgi:hypothetical protein